MEPYPIRSRFAAIIWGFFNDNVANTLIPATVAFRSDLTQVELSGADRAPSPAKLTVGMLRKITYPAGRRKRFVRV